MLEIHFLFFTTGIIVGAMIVILMILAALSIAAAIRSSQFTQELEHESTRR